MISKWNIFFFERKVTSFISKNSSSQKEMMNGNLHLIPGGTLQVSYEIYQVWSLPYQTTLTPKKKKKNLKQFILILCKLDFGFRNILSSFLSESPPDASRDDFPPMVSFFLHPIPLQLLSSSFVVAGITQFTPRIARNMLHK